MPTADTDGTGVRVAVYNGTLTTGMAGKASDALKASGFTVTKTTTAPSTNHATTVVEYGNGQKANAEKVATLFPGATLTPTSAAGISLVLGKDYAATHTTTTATPTVPTLSATVTENARSADDDICAKTTYGTGG